MSAIVVNLAAYRRARTPKRPRHCSACGQPGHYQPTCTDREALQRWRERQQAYWARRRADILAQMPVKP